MSRDDDGHLVSPNPSQQTLLTLSQSPFPPLAQETMAQACTCAMSSCAHPHPPDPHLAHPPYLATTTAPCPSTSPTCLAICPDGRGGSRPSVPLTHPSRPSVRLAHIRLPRPPASPTHPVSHLSRPPVHLFMNVNFVLLIIRSTVTYLCGVRTTP